MLRGIAGVEESRRTRAGLVEPVLIKAQYCLCSFAGNRFEIKFPAKVGTDTHDQINANSSWYVLPRLSHLGIDPAYLHWGHTVPWIINRNCSRVF